MKTYNNINNNFGNAKRTLRTLLLPILLIFLPISLSAKAISINLYEDSSISSNSAIFSSPSTDVDTIQKKENTQKTNRPSKVKTGCPTPTVKYLNAIYTIDYKASGNISPITPTIDAVNPTYSISNAAGKTLTDWTGLIFNIYTGTISGTPNRESIARDYTVTIKNDCGTQAQTTITIEIKCAAPTVKYTNASEKFLINNPVDCSPILTGSPSSLTISPTLPAGLIFNTSNGKISGKPTACSTRTTYTITATNTCTTKGTTTLDIETTTPDGILNYTPNPYTGTRGVDVSITPSTNQTFTNYTCLSLPLGLIIDPNSGAISGKPLAVSTGEYTVSCKDFCGKTVTTTVTIDIKCPKPTINYFPQKKILIINKSVKIVPTTSEPLQEFIITPSLPDSLRFNPATGEITGIPRFGIPETNYTVSAKNDCGEMTTCIFTIEIIDYPRFTYQKTYTLTALNTITPSTPLVSGGRVRTTGTSWSVYEGSTGVSGYQDGKDTPRAFKRPTGIAFDNKGNLFVADTVITKSGVTLSLIKKISPDGVITTPGCTRWGITNKLATDTAGNVYFYDRENDVATRSSVAKLEIPKVENGFNIPETYIYDNLIKPSGLAFDTIGNLFMADLNNNTIRVKTKTIIDEYAAPGKSIGNCNSFTAGKAIAIDAKQNLFVITTGNKLLKIRAKNVVDNFVDLETYSIYYPSAMVIDQGGTIYITDSIANSITEIKANGTVTPYSLPTGLTLNKPLDIALDGCGNLIVADAGNNRIVKITRHGYLITPDLPNGLSFDNTTGEISGTPIAGSPTTTYTTTAINECGCNFQTFKLKVNQPTNDRYIGGTGHGDHLGERKLITPYGNVFNNNLGLGTGQWAEPKNWSLKHIPTANEDAIIQAAATVTKSQACGNLIIEGGGSVTIPGSLADGFMPINRLDVTEAIYGATTANLKVLSGKDSINGTLVFHNAENDPVNAQVDMFSKAIYPRFQFFGPPTKVVDIHTDIPNAYIYRYNENDISAHWEGIYGQENQYMRAFEPFAVTNDWETTYNFKGELVNKDTTMVLQKTLGASWPGNQLMSNPYTAPINIRNDNPEYALQFSGEMERTVYLYNTGSYAEWEYFYKAGDQTGTNRGQYLSVPQGHAGVYKGLPATIPSMQGFLIWMNRSELTPVSNNTTKIGVLRIPYAATTNSSKRKEGNIIVDNNNPEYPQRSKRMNSKEETTDNIYSIISVMGKTLGDAMWLITDPQCTRKFDNGFDGRKILGEDGCPVLYAHEEDDDYQVNSIPDINNTLLAFRAGTDETYTLHFTHYNTKKKYARIYLLDLADNTKTDITESGTEYTFTDTNSKDQHIRFKIITGQELVTGQEEISENKLRIFNNDCSLFVENKTNLNGTVTIYDLSGRALESFPFNADGITRIELHYPMGGYIAKAITNQKSITKKLILNRCN